MKKFHPYILAILPITLFYIVCCWKGNLKSPDSEYYLYIAENLYHNFLYYGPGGRPIVYWPPLYSIVLIPGVVFNGYPFFLQLSLLILHQFIWVRIMEKCAPVNHHLLGTVSILGLNTLVLLCSIYVWSEMLFMVLMAWAYLSVLRYQETVQRKHLYTLSFALFLALLTRNAGIFFIPGFILFGLVMVTKDLRFAFITAVLIGTLGNVLWNLNRLVFMDHLHVFGELFPVFTPVDNITFTLEEILANFLPRAWLESVWVISLAGMLLFFLAIRNIGRYSSSEVFIGMVFLSYTVFWFLIPAERDNLGRFLAPAFPHFLILLQINLQRVLVSKYSKWALIMVNAYFILFSFARILKNVIDLRQLI